MIEEGIEKEGVACDVGTKSKEQCQNVTVSSFKVEEMLSNVSLTCFGRVVLCCFVFLLCCVASSFCSVVLHCLAFLSISWMIKVIHMWYRACYCMDHLIIVSLEQQPATHRGTSYTVKISTLVGSHNQKSAAIVIFFSTSMYMYMYVRTVPAVVDSHTDGISSGFSSGTSVPLVWLCILDMLVLWEVWRWPFTETQSRLRHVCLYCAPIAQCTWTPVSLKIHTSVLASCVHRYASVYTFCIA